MHTLEINNNRFSYYLSYQHFFGSFKLRQAQGSCLRHYAILAGQNDRWNIAEFFKKAFKINSLTSGIDLAPLAIMITMPFGVTADLASRHPWESIKKYLKDTSLAEFYMGFVYIATGERGEEGCNPCQGA